MIASQWVMLRAPEMVSRFANVPWVDQLDHPQRPIAVQEPQPFVDELVASDPDGSRYGFVGYAANLVYLPPVRQPALARIAFALSCWPRGPPLRPP